jgi:hypothetical protein
MVSNPQKLGCCESGHGQIAGDCTQIGDRGLQGLAFLSAATVVPQNGWAKHLVITVEENGTVHLTRQANPGQALQRLWALMRQLIHDSFKRGPPSMRRLLGPKRMWTLNTELRASRCNGSLLCVDQQSFEL